MRPTPTSSGLDLSSKLSAALAHAAADYQLGTSGPFVSPRIALSALADAESAFALLDALEADPARLTAAARTVRPLVAPGGCLGKACDTAMPVSERPKTKLTKLSLTTRSPITARGPGNRKPSLTPASP